MAEDKDVNFLELACMFKIGPDATFERFGSSINSSIFDAANITGSMKLKGLIDFTAYYPGPNNILLTDAGKKIKDDAESRSGEAIDGLDDEILRQLSGGKRYPAELQTALNIRQKDLAFRIYKLFKQNLLGYEVKNGNAELTLTENGFLRAKNPPMPQQQMPMPNKMQPNMQQAGMQQQTEMAMQAPEQEPMPKMTDAQVLNQINTERKKGKQNMILGVLLVIVLAALGYLHFYMHAI